jgi:excisionase family DNA binding protein
MAKRVMPGSGANAADLHAAATTETSSAEALPAVLTMDEAAVLLRIGRNSAYEAARRGEIPTIRLGRRLLVPRVALERLLEQACADPGGGEASDGR